MRAISQPVAHPRGAAATAGRSAAVSAARPPFPLLDRRPAAVFLQMSPTGTSFTEIAPVWAQMSRSADF
jgi:hypothetical protein